MKQREKMKFCQTVEKVNRTKLFWITIGGLMGGYILLGIVSFLPFRLIFEIAIYLGLTFLGYYVIRYGVADYMYIVTMDKRFLIARKVGSFQKVLFEAEIDGIKIKPYKEGKKGQNFCGHTDRKKYLGTYKKDTFIFQPSDELLEHLKEA